MPANGDSICPWEALKLLLVRFPAPKHAPLFCQNHQHGYLSGMYFTRDWFLDSLRGLLIKAGINPVGYNGHSFRRGAAHSAAAAGMSDEEIETLGRWKSDSYKLYTGRDDVRRLKLASTVTRKLRSSSTAAPRSKLPWTSVAFPGRLVPTGSSSLGGESAGIAFAAQGLPKTQPHKNGLFLNQNILG